MGILHWRPYAGLLLGIMTALIAAACGGAEPTRAPTPPPTSVPPGAPTAAPTATARAAPTAAATSTPVATATPLPRTPTPAGPTPKYGGMLQTRLPPGQYGPVWDTFNPRGAYNFGFMAMWLNNLLHLDLRDGSKLAPDLAERWDLGQDGTVHTLYLRKDANWHDGKPFTSADALFTLTEAWKSSDPARTWNRGLFARVTDIRAPDSSTVRITLDRPSASFLPGLGVPFMLVYPAHIPDTSQWQKSPVGTGPFIPTSLNLDVSIESRKNGGYFKKDAAGRPLPYLDGVVDYVLTDEAAVAAFRVGKIDCGCPIGEPSWIGANLPALKRTIPDLQLYPHPTPVYLYVNSKPPLDDQRVRQAISIGLDRKFFADSSQEGFNFHPMGPFLPPDFGGQWGLTVAEMLQIPGWRADHAADVQLAKGLLAQSGVKVGDFKIDVLASPSLSTDATVVASVLSRDMGLNTTVQTPAGAELTARYIRGDFGLYRVGPAPSFEDPSQYGSPYFLTGSATNTAKWSNPEIDRLFLAIDQTLDPPKRLALAKEVQRKLIDWAVLIPVVDAGRAAATRGVVKGFIRSTAANLDVSSRLETVWLER